MGLGILWIDGNRAIKACQRFLMPACTEQRRAKIVMGGGAFGVDRNGAPDARSALIQPARLRVRIQIWAEEESRLGNLHSKSFALLDALLLRGELPRGEAENILNTGERQARRVVSALLEKGVLTSASPRAPLRMAFPAILAARWLPGLFPDQPA